MRVSRIRWTGHDCSKADMDVIEKSQRLRALNMIWNAAGSYALRPTFKVYDQHGLADLYWNSIIGAVCKHYDMYALESMFRSFEGDLAEYQLKSLFWLGLENAAYARELPNRPAFENLRARYARQVLLTPPVNAGDPTVFERVQAARCRRILGEPYTLSPYCQRLLDLLDFDASMDTEAILERAREAFALYFSFAPAEEPQESPAEAQRAISIPFLSRFIKKRSGGAPERGVRKFGAGSAEYAGADVRSTEQPDVQLSAFSVLSEKELRDFMANYFGVSILAQPQITTLENRLCTGNHAGCHLHFTRGSFAEKTGYKGKADYLKMSSLRQREKNRAYYEAHRTEAQHNIARLGSRIRNSMLTHLQNSVVKAGAGKLDIGRVWRLLELDDDKVFTKELRGDSGDISVDILLDASNSQTKRQETLSTQAYIIAESLTRCGLPVRVSSFCSLRGFTIFHIFRDYTENDQNENIFGYFTAGCNRDGLAIRTAKDMLRQNNCEHKLLILLSDVRPNGVQRSLAENGEYCNYTEDFALKDTAAEVRSAQREGICVLCVFTGDDNALGAAKLVYGTSFTRIKSLEHFADAVGSLIQEQIRVL